MYRNCIRIGSYNGSVEKSCRTWLQSFGCSRTNLLSDQTPDFPDWKGDFENSVQKEKEAYIREHRLTVWRDHDHMHTHQPDSIFAGVIKYLGWESYFNTEISGMMPFFYVFDIPECTVSELGEELKEK